MAVSLAKGDFRRIYSKTARMLGNIPIHLSHDENVTLLQAGFPPFRSHALHELGRMALLLYAIELLDPERHTVFIEDLFVRGDLAERQALLRTFSFLPRPDRFLSIAVEACRSNVQTVFEAIACENSYPLRYFPELNFNQMVMKAVFVGVPILRIIGLSTRITPVLLEMVQDYVQEQTTAGRPVSEDIYLIGVGGGER